MKKVLHVVGGMDLGGTETMLMNLYRKINKQMYFDFISYYDREGYYDNEIRRLGGNVIRCDSPSKIGQIKSTINLYKIIRENNYDIVHAHTLFNCGTVMIAAKLAGVKIRISHAHTNLDNITNLMKKFYINIMRVLIRIFSTKYVACSESAAVYLFGKSIVNKKNYKILHNYVNYEEILLTQDKNSIREELKLAKDDVLIGHIGRFVEAKNHEFLIDIINEIIKVNKNVKVILVGDGPLRNNIENKIKELDLIDNVFLLGLRNDINIILNNLDLFIFPSKYEGLGLVILEAQAAGVKCLVSEAIQEEADLNIGLLKKIELKVSAKKWAEAALQENMNRYVNKNSIREAFKEKRYDLNSIIGNLKMIYEES